MRHEKHDSRLATHLPVRLGRRRVLTAGAAVAASLVAGRPRVTRAAPAAQEGSSIWGGRWRESDAFALSQRADPAEYIVFATDFPFYALAPSWGGEGDPAATVELLWSPDGVAWSEPLWIGRAGHGGPPDRDGRHIGALVSTPGGTFLQYRTFDSTGNPTVLPDFEIDYIDATAGPTLEQVAAPATTPMFAQPPIISRASWGADESLRFNKRGVEIFPVEYQTVEHIIIHHADTANFNDPVLEMRSIYYFHAVTRGWGDIAYNYLVDFMGNIYEGRVGGENAIGCHAEGYNAGSCGICLMGRFFEDDTTPEMHNAVVWIAAWAARNVDPGGSKPFHDIPDLPTICGHRDVNRTTCPGDVFYSQIAQARTEARAIITGQVDPVPDPPQWPPGSQVVTNAEGTKLRSGPGLAFDVVTEMTLGEPLVVLQGPTTNDGRVWFEVQGRSLSGWISGDLLSPNPDPNATVTPLPSEPVVEEPVVEEPVEDEPVTDDPADDGSGGGGRRRRRNRNRRQEAWPIFSAGTATIVDGGPLNLRVEPGLWADIITALPDGYPATILAGPVDGDGIAWYQVVTPEAVEGWCDGTYLVPI